MVLFIHCIRKSFLDYFAEMQKRSILFLFLSWIYFEQIWSREGASTPHAHRGERQFGHRYPFYLSKENTFVSKSYLSVDSVALYCSFASLPPCAEPVFVNLLRSPGIDFQPICRTGPPGYIGWRNRFLDSPWTSIKTGSGWAKKSLVYSNLLVVGGGGRLAQKGTQLPRNPFTGNFYGLCTGDQHYIP